MNINMKRKGHAVVLGMILMAVCTGCGRGNKNENITAGMEAIEALNYDSALGCFEAAREAGENERLLYRGEGMAYMGKTMYAEAAQAFETALSLSNGRINSMDYDINYYLAAAYYKQGELGRAIDVYSAIVALRDSEKDA